MELEPCPFCGCECQVLKVRPWNYKIVGDHKETCMFFNLLWQGGYDSEEEAAAAWNRRANDV